LFKQRLNALDRFVRMLYRAMAGAPVRLAIGHRHRSANARRPIVARGTLEKWMDDVGMETGK
jgi:hypothetical protein